MIEINNLTVRKGNTTILNDVTYSFPENGWSTIIGPNGAGKSTLLKALLGGVEYSGSIKINGVEAFKNKKTNIAFIPQNPPIPPGMSVIEYVSLGRIRHYSFLNTNRNDREIIRLALDQLELLGLQEHTIFTLSGGELQRAFIARAIVQQPQIVILDEPTSALDLHHQISTLNHIEILKNSGVKIISVMHDLTVSALYSDELLLLDKGTALISGTPDQVIHSPLLQQAFSNRISVFTSEDGNPIVYGKRNN